MKYLIAVTIESDKSLSAENLQHIKSLVEETVIENLDMPDGVSVFLGTRVTKESD